MNYKDIYIYHITHIDNMSDIIQQGFLYSDAKRIELRINHKNIGMNEIKRRRLSEIYINCWPNTFAGNYVPFYFCPRSIMLYLFYRDNHPELTYHGGQEPIVHLASKLSDVIDWAQANSVKWAFSATNAGARYTVFYNDLSRLDEIDWKAVKATDFKKPAVKDKKQAEFLVYERLPFELISKIGVQNRKVLDKIGTVLENSSYSPKIEIEKDWYY